MKSFLKVILSQSRRRASASFLSVLLVSVPLIAPGAARVADPEDQYVTIVNVIEQADSLSSKGQASSAAVKYRQAYADLVKFAKANPRWNPQVVSFRLEYLAGKVGELTEKPAAPAAQSPAAPGTNSVAQASSSTQPAGAQLKVLEPGAEPRTALRLHPKAGDKQRMSMTLQMSVEMKMGQMQNPPMKFPPMKFSMDITVQNVTPEGDIAYEAVMGEAMVGEEAGGNPQMAQAIKTALSGVKGLTMTGKVSNRGFNEGLDLAASGGSQNAQARQLLDQMKDSMGDMFQHLPEEPVGPGAKWEVKMPVKSQGMTIDQTASCQLVSLESERLKTKTTITQRASNQKVQNPGMPGMDLNLNKMSGSGTSDVTVDLTKLWPLQATAKMRSDSSISVNVSGQKQTMDTRTDISLQMESK